MFENNDVNEIEFDAASIIGISTEGEQYLTFVLGEQEFGIEILRVQEIRGWAGVTKVPKSEPYMLGVINLRGEIIPVYDLRIKFESGEPTYTPMTVVIVMHVDQGGKQKTIGIVVDAVSEVYGFDEGSIEELPTAHGVIEPESIKGIAAQGDEMIILLDADRIVGQ